MLSIDGSGASLSPPPPPSGVNERSKSAVVNSGSGLSDVRSSLKQTLRSLGDFWAKLSANASWPIFNSATHGNRSAGPSKRIVETFGCTIACSAREIPQTRIAETTHVFHLQGITIEEA
jgi:hypothetical protein